MAKKYYFIVAILLYTVLLIINNQKASRVIFCNVGQGDGAVIQRGWYQIIIDTGKDGQMMAECLSRYMPFGDKKIDEVIISHQDNDHNGGLELLKKFFEIGQIHGEKMEYKKNGLEIVSGTGGKDNSDSYVIKFLGIKNEYWFTGDIDSKREEELEFEKSGRKVILKVSHHGSKFSTGLNFLNKLKPDLAIISVGKNFYGHPSKEVLARLKELKIKHKRTDKWGDVVIVD